MLTIAVSSRSLFHIEDGHDIFATKGQEAFDAYMREKEDIPLRPGPAFPIVRKLLALNSGTGLNRDRVDVVMLSRNSPDAGMRVMNSIQHYGLDIERAVFCSGTDRFRYAKEFGAHLFLSANPTDVRTAIEHGIAAATMLPVEQADEEDNLELRIAFDGDAVLFSAEADECYRAHGLETFRRTEVEKANVPLGDGPMKTFLKALQEVQGQFPQGKAPLKIALVTARGMPSHARVIHTLRSWGLYVDEAIFAGGLPKGPLLKAFGATIFFDDTQRNIDSAVSYDIPSGHVPFGSGQGIVREAPAAPAEVPAPAAA